ncbi:MAG: oligopeptidase A, partial [Deltaproteobacteria bacterium]|nr:oligopeptidase A [Deltaproteobacteria bacterium]
MNLRMASLAWLALAGSACQNPPARFSSTSNSSASASAPHGGFSASMAGAWPRVGGAAAATSDATAGRPGSASAAPRATAEPASSRYRTVEPLALVEPFGAASDPDALARLCDSGLEAARLRLAAVLERAEAPSGELGWEVTFGRLDEARLALANATELASLLGVVHPSAAMRSAAGECELRAEAVETELFVEPRVLAVLERAAAALRAPGAPPLTAERGRFIDETLRELVRNGARLDAAGRERLTWINERVTETGQGFIAALSGPQGGLKVRASQLKGMSETFRRAHPPDSDRKVILSTEPSEVAEFLTFAEDRTAARALHVKLLNRGGEANVARLDRLLALRREKAQLLGHASWADFVTAGRMAGSASAVRAFLERVERAIAPAVEREFAELMREHMRQPGYRPRLALTEADRLYLIERLRARTYKIDSAKVAEYFEIESVTRGLFELSTELFGVAFQEVVAPVWHPSVRAFDVSRAGVSLGRIYLDRFARPDKYRNPAMFGVRGRRRFSDGREQLPVAALVARLSEPNKPMPHEQVAIYFHEFGHVLQHLLSENELASYAGTNVPRDAVEA